MRLKNRKKRHNKRSLSARRAWIEIAQSVPALGYCIVALRKESVDRNRLQIQNKRKTHQVALRKESVDRNVNLRVVDGSKSCRSPQGERG